MRDWDLFWPVVKWLAWIAMFFLIEIPALRSPGRRGTLSYIFAWVYQTRTRRGKLTFAISIGGAVGWFIAHILTDMNETAAVVAAEVQP